jgi:hypothetical protein
VIERTLDDLARIDGRAIDGSAKQRLEADDAVARVEEKAAKHLVGEVAEPGAEALGRVTRLLEYPAPVEWTFEMAPTELERGMQAGDPRAAQALRSQQLTRARAKKGVETSPLLEQCAGERLRLRLSRADSKD